MKRLLTTIGALTAVAGLTLPALAGAAEPRPTTLVLQPRDVPRGFVLDQGRIVTNDELTASATNTKDYRKLGRLTGYDASYSALALSGLTEVDAFASIYRTSSGAHDSLLQAVEQAKKSGSKIERLQPVGMPGNEALAYRTTSRGANMKVDYYTVAWRRGSVFAEVIGGGRAGTVDWVDVLPLAKKQDVRIAKGLSN